MSPKINQIKDCTNSSRMNWLRAAVLGANDGIVSTAGIIVGVAAAQGSYNSILIAAIASLVAGATSMAAGEYVSVSSQRDSERAECIRARKKLAPQKKDDKEKLIQIYLDRGLQRDLAEQVSQQLMAHQTLEKMSCNELNSEKQIQSKPLQAALASALSFAIGSGLPIMMILITPLHFIIPCVSIISLLCLSSLGAVAAYIGGADIVRGSIRVLFWGTLALALTIGVGTFFGISP